MNIETFRVGIMETNCYFLSDDNNDLALIVDPGAPSKSLDSRISEFGADKIKYILLTHGHFDHIGNAEAIREKTGSKIVIYRDEENFLKNSGLNLAAFMGGLKIQPFSADIVVSDGEVLSWGNKRIKVIHTPGHTSGSCCYIIDNIMFSGDTLMANSMGRTDFPTGNINDMMNSLKKIKDLDINYKIYCGHGNSTILENECKNNLYMKNL